MSTSRPESPGQGVGAAGCGRPATTVLRWIVAAPRPQSGTSGIALRYSFEDRLIGRSGTCDGFDDRHPDRESGLDDPALLGNVGEPDCVVTDQVVQRRHPTVRRAIPFRVMSACA